MLLAILSARFTIRDPHMHPAKPSIASLLVLVILVVAACDATEPGEDDLRATRISLMLENESSPDTVSWSAEEPAGLIDGVTLRADTLVLTSGMTFSGRVRFFGESGADLTDRIRREAERFQLFYEISDVDKMRIMVRDNETNYGPNQFGVNLPVGLEIAFTTPVTEDPIIGSIRVKVGYFAPGQKNGFTLTVDPLYDFIIPVRIVPIERPPEPPAPPVATTFQFDLVRLDELRTISLTAERPAGLNLFGARIPVQNIDVAVCERESVDDAFSCEQSKEISVFQREHFTGHVIVSDRDSGEAFTEHVRANQEEYRIFYDLPFSPLGMTYDEDANGLPVGLEIDWDIPGNIQIGNGRMGFRMLEYDREWGGDKGSSRSTATLVDFTVTFNLHR